MLFGNILSQTLRMTNIGHQRMARGLHKRPFSRNLVKLAATCHTSRFWPKWHIGAKLVSIGPQVSGEVGETNFSNCPPENPFSSQSTVHSHNVLQLWRQNKAELNTMPVSLFSGARSLVITSGQVTDIFALEDWSFMSGPTFGMSRRCRFNNCYSVRQSSRLLCLFG